MLSLDINNSTFADVRNNVILFSVLMMFNHSRNALYIKIHRGFQKRPHLITVQVTLVLQGLLAQCCVTTPLANIRQFFIYAFSLLV
jgi:hypothetical protein